MKYIKTLYFLAQVAAVIVVILGAVKGACLLCAAVDPGLDALLGWLSVHALPIAVTVVIGFVVWIFGDVCDAQARKERQR